VSVQAIQRTSAQRRQVVAGAVRFIKNRIKLHRRQFALEVGKHLFENVYFGDRAYYERTGRKDLSIERIASAPGVKVSANSLRMCVRVHLLTQELGRTPDSEIPDLPVLDGPPARLPPGRYSDLVDLPGGLFALAEDDPPRLVPVES